MPNGGARDGAGAGAGAARIGGGAVVVDVWPNEKPVFDVAGAPNDIDPPDVDGVPTNEHTNVMYDFIYFSTVCPNNYRNLEMMFQNQMPVQVQSKVPKLPVLLMLAMEPMANQIQMNLLLPALMNNAKFGHKNEN